MLDSTYEITFLALYTKAMNVEKENNINLSISCHSLIGLIKITLYSCIRWLLRGKSSLLVMWRVIQNSMMFF